jgi:hypothetical protein
MRAVTGTIDAIEVVLRDIFPEGKPDGSEFTSPRDRMVAIVADRPIRPNDEVRVLAKPAWVG